MKTFITIGGAILAFAALASTAEARIGGMPMSSSFSRTDGHMPIASPVAQVRNFCPSGAVGLNDLDGKTSQIYCKGKPC